MRDFGIFSGSEREVRLFTNNSLWAKPLNYCQTFAREKTLVFTDTIIFLFMKNLGNIVSHQAPIACVVLEEKYPTKCEDAKNHQQRTSL